MSEFELFLAWCKVMDICPDDGWPELNGRVRRDPDGTVWLDHLCEPDEWFGPPIPEGVCRFPPGMSVG